MLSTPPPCSLRVLPHHQDTGGFFIAVLHKSVWLPWQRRAQRGDSDESATASDSSRNEESQRPSVLGAGSEGVEVAGRERGEGGEGGEGTSEAHVSEEAELEREGASSEGGGGSMVEVGDAGPALEETPSRPNLGRYAVTVCAATLHSVIQDKH